ncbi:MAG: hypothetical protein HDQ87_11890 [Clostridia bacterium]|nr:hypothetical protein [Clostridia bacterium]
MHNLEERDRHLKEQLHSLELARREHKKIAGKLEESQEEVNRLEGDLHTVQRVLRDLQENKDFDPAGNDEQLEQLTKETVRSRRLMDELKEALSVLANLRKESAANEKLQKEILSGIRETYEKFGWNQPEKAT